jgi:hypothetical protein
MSNKEYIIISVCAFIMSLIILEGFLTKNMERSFRLFGGFMFGILITRLWLNDR